jgi:hypothetical protein
MFQQKMSHNVSQSLEISLALRIEDMRKARINLCNQVNALDTAIASAELEYSQVTNLLAPVSSIPEEVLSIIFQAAYELSTVPVEMIVSQVTQTWRRVALSTPRLWTKIHLLVGHSWSPVNIAEKYLSRSGALPLHLHISIDSFGADTEIFASACLQFHSHANRWRRLKVDCAWGPRFAQLVRSFSSACVPLLQSAQICWERDEDESECVTACNIFTGGAPRLASLKLRGFGVQCCLPPLSAVNNLQIHEPFNKINIARLASILDGLSVLTHLVINGDFIDSWTPVAQIYLPSLQSFHLYTHDDVTQIPGLLNAISAPLLHSLLLEGVVCEEIDDFSNGLYPTLQTPKFPSLRSLALFSVERTRSQLWAWTNIFRAFPSVTQFALFFTDWYDFSSHLQEDTQSQSPSAIPRWLGLETLTLLDRGTDVVPPTYLREILSVLTASNHPIRKLQLSTEAISALGDEYALLREQIAVEENTLYTGPFPFVRWSNDD